MLEKLRELGIRDELIREITEYRETYPVEQEYGSRIPKLEQFYYGKEVWEQAITAILCGENILLAGPKATGKSLFAENLAGVFTRPRWDVSFHVNMDAASLIGMDTFRGGEVSFRPGPVYTAAKAGGFAILDEINMAKSEAMAVLHATLDFRRTIDVSLYGQGILVAIIDSGIDYANIDFRNADGSTRIRYLWDQSLNPADGETAPVGYSIGVEYTKGQIDEALNAQTVSEQRRLVRSQDISGHGTAVAGVAAGNGRNSGGRYAGVAMQSELIVVKLGNPIQEGFPRTTELMMGIDYIIRKALELRMPVAVNISFGNTYGGHDGTTLLERYIDDVSNIWKSVFCIGTGNEVASAGHTSGRIISEGEETIQLAIQSRQSSISIQIWKEYTDQIEISIINPSGVRVGPVPEILGPHRFRIGQTEILLYYGEPSPYSISQEIYIDLLPVESYLTEGIWRIVLSAGKIVTGQYEMWLPSDNVLNRGTGFLFPTDATTLTIPSSASRAISVGAYDARTFAYADFSGRGFTRLTNMVKPDLVAPGVEVMTTTVGGGYAAFTGTSFATPFVTGSAALLMEWGIVRGNDPYLYGEKVKAYLRRGAKKVPGFDEYPNEEVGYGALCTAQSLPQI